jgi:yeast amino acid transporter
MASPPPPATTSPPPPTTPPATHRDIELGPAHLKEDSLVLRGSTHSTREPEYDAQPSNYFRRIRDSFKRDPSRRITPQDPKHEAETRAGEMRAVAHSGHYYDIHQAMLQTAHSGLARKLKGRHLQMIAIGGSIGTG